MDTQFIGEKSTLLTWYVTKYMNKAGKNELFDSILDSKNNNNKSLEYNKLSLEYCVAIHK